MPHLDLGIKSTLNLAVFLILLSLIVIKAQYLWGFTQIDRQLNQIRQDLHQKSRERLLLEQQLQTARTPEYLEWQAREQLNLIAENETLLILPSPIPVVVVPPEDTAPQRISWFRQLIWLFSG